MHIDRHTAWSLLVCPIGLFFDGKKRIERQIAPYTWILRTRRAITGEPITFPQLLLAARSTFKLVSKRDADALSAKLGQPYSWLEIGRKGRPFVEREFDLSKRNDALVELYRKA
jgi:hypothetical protein